MHQPCRARAARPTGCLSLGPAARAQQSGAESDYRGGLHHLWPEGSDGFGFCGMQFHMIGRVFGGRNIRVTGLAMALASLTAWYQRRRRKARARAGE